MHTAHTKDQTPLPNSAQLRKERKRTVRTKNQRFGELDTTSQLQEFFAWLPQELYNAPGIDWKELPIRIMGYLTRSVGKSPDAAFLAMSAASISGAVDTPTFAKMLGSLNNCLIALRNACQIKHVSDLERQDVWYDFISKTEVTDTRYRMLQSYSSVSASHFPAYLQRLNEQDRLRVQKYKLPPLPHEFLKHHGGKKALQKAGQDGRKARSDIIIPLFPVLRQLVHFRKQLADRTIKAIREARRKVEVGEAELPFHFAVTDTIPEINREARTIAEAEIYGREVTMNFTLWDKPTWVLQHTGRYSPTVVREANARIDSYTPDLNIYFVQFNGDPSNLLWFGELIEHRLLQNFTPSESRSEEYLKRWKLARELGFSSGCVCDRPGLLSTSDQWFAFHEQVGDFLFEPESIYRGVLFGTTLAMLAFSNGSRVSELLQVSLNKERRITRTEMVTVLGEDGRPIIGVDGKPQTKQVKIHLQYLLPKGAKSDEERQLFPLSKEAVRLLGEIKKLLEEVYGEVPVVTQHHNNVKQEHLKPEQYFFQWATTSDGRLGILNVNDVQILLRFILHGLEFFTTKGDRILISAHLLRHVMATDAKQYRHIPADAIAHFFLHHRMKSLHSPFASTSVVSNYYFQMTEEQRLATIREYLDEQEEQDAVLVLATLTPQDLERKNEDLRVVYELWHALHPTALGNCGCPGLCPRGNDRSLCLGCSYHVEDPEKLGAALAWRESYAMQGVSFEAQGNIVDARQARIKVQQLDDMINIMRMQLQEEAAGRYIPLSKILPSPYRKIEEGHEEAF